MSDAELASYAEFIRAQVDELAHRVRGNQQHPAWVDWTQACMIADEIQVELLRRWLCLDSERSLLEKAGDLVESNER